MSYNIKDLPASIAEHIQVNPETGCWEWTGGKISTGYGNVRYDGTQWLVHRLAYVLLVGDIPDDRPHVDHVHDRGCRSKTCCWPEHLEPVTQAENMRRWAETNATCRNGHKITAENSRITSAGHRRCRDCDRATNARNQDRYKGTRNEYYRAYHAANRERRLAQMRDYDARRRAGSVLHLAVTT